MSMHQLAMPMPPLPSQPFSAMPMPSHPLAFPSEGSHGASGLSGPSQPIPDASAPLPDASAPLMSPSAMSMPFMALPHIPFLPNMQPHLPFPNMPPGCLPMPLPPNMPGPGSIMPPQGPGPSGHPPPQPSQPLPQAAHAGSPQAPQAPWKPFPGSGPKPLAAMRCCLCVWSCCTSATFSSRARSPKEIFSAGPRTSATCLPVVSEGSISLAWMNLNLQPVLSCISRRLQPSLPMVGPINS
mmetsp:Transcript_65587/g.202991  ORF Transcript_65587/g.202991 Transcript_65587/m.202991 type:complete len:240 (-) Transcript_65587:547-1266(-)